VPFFKASAFSELLKYIASAASCQSFFLTFFGFFRILSKPVFQDQLSLFGVSAVLKGALL